MLATMKEQPTIQALTRDVIRGKLAALNTMDADLTRRLALLYGKPSSGSAPFDAAHGEKTRDRARSLLNGAGHILEKSPGAAAGETDLFAEREAVRLALSALQREDLEAASVEAQQLAEKLRPGWEKICRGFVIKAAEFTALAAQAEAFIDAAGEARFALAMAHLVGRGADIDLGRGESVATLIKYALAEKLVTDAEIRKAQHATA
jgi:hypothetical protein